MHTSALSVRGAILMCIFTPQAIGGALSTITGVLALKEYHSNCIMTLPKKFEWRNVVVGRSFQQVACRFACISIAIVLLLFPQVSASWHVDVGFWCMAAFIALKLCMVLCHFMVPVPRHAYLTFNSEHEVTPMPGGVEKSIEMDRVSSDQADTSRATV